MELKSCRVGGSEKDKRTSQKFCPLLLKKGSFILPPNFFLLIKTTCIKIQLVFFKQQQNKTCIDAHTPFNMYIHETWLLKPQTLRKTLSLTFDLRGKTQKIPKLDCFTPDLTTYTLFTLVDLIALSISHYSAL